MKLYGIVSIGFKIANQLLIRFSTFVLEKILECSETVHQLFTDFKKAYDSMRREVLYNIFIEFWVHMKLVRL
jgi:hypothetical protein